VTLHASRLGITDPSVQEGQCHSGYVYMHAIILSCVITLFGALLHTQYWDRKRPFFLWYYETHV